MSDGIAIMRAVIQSDAKFESELRRLHQVLTHLATALHEKGVSSILHKAKSMTEDSIRGFAHLVAEDRQNIAEGAAEGRRERREVKDLATIHRELKELEATIASSIDHFRSLSAIDKEMLKETHNFEVKVDEHFTEGVLNDPDEIERLCLVYLEQCGRNGSLFERHTEQFNLTEKFMERNNALVGHMNEIRQHEEQLEGEHKTRIGQYLQHIRDLIPRLIKAKNLHVENIEYNTMLTKLINDILVILRFVKEHKETREEVHNKLPELKALTERSQQAVTKMIEIEDKITEYLAEDEHLVKEIREKFEELVHRG